jgi:hypothetical protein
VKQLETESEHSALSSAELRDERSCNSVPPVGIRGAVRKKLYTLDTNPKADEYRTLEEQH